METNTNYLREYIKALIKNVSTQSLPVSKEINLIFDGGALNGVLGMGVALYVKGLEDANLVSIKKISGCSIGALLAVWFICDCPEDTMSFIQDLFESYKCKKNFAGYHDMVRAVINHTVAASDDIQQKLQDRLYINFFNTSTGQQEIISSFPTREHLINCIIRSGHVPYLLDGSARVDEHYMDGMIPYIFPKSEGPSLFIKLVTIRNSPDLLKVSKSENNIYNRVFCGVAEANNYFVQGTGNGMCSYVHQWNTLTQLKLSSRPIIVLTVLTIIELIMRIYQFIPSALKESLLSLYFQGILKEWLMAIFTFLVEN